MITPNNTGTKTLLILYRFSIPAASIERAAFEAAYKEYKATHEPLDGQLDEMLVRSLHTPTDYLIISKWTEDSFNKWLQSPEHDQVVRLLDQFGRTHTQVTRYTVEALFTT